tara:strand:+ start:1294 stop:1431 length:138 start_codon:yes stop_codon:yes gene_type:complete
VSLLFKWLMRTSYALVIFIVVYAAFMGLLNDMCNCANDWALNNFL